MKRLFFALIILTLSQSSAWAGMDAPKDLKDLYFGAALYHAFQEDWFEAIARLDTELQQYYGVDEPKRDSLYTYIGQAQFGVGDFELAYRMHQRAGRAIKAVIEGNVPDPVRNEAIFRLARIYFQKGQPDNAQYAVDRIKGTVPPEIRDDLNFLRAQIHMANGRYADAAGILINLQNAEGLKGFAEYNLGVALIKDGKKAEGRTYLDKTGQIQSSDDLVLAIKDKANYVLGSKLLDEKKYPEAKLMLDRIRLEGPFSNKALLASGWADAFQGHYDRALVPWTALVTREVTDSAVQEAMLAVPYSYGKLNVYSKAALMYGSALKNFSLEIDKLDESIKSILDGHFLEALAREELKQGPDWVVRLRKLPQTPETYYLLNLMASHDFQESLKNYLDLEQLRKKLVTWENDLDAFEGVIKQRKAYYQPLLPTIDQKFRQLDSQMRLRLEQRERIEQRLKKMRVAPRPDYLMTAEERITLEKITELERTLKSKGKLSDAVEARIKRLRGVLDWKIYTEYDQRFTEAFQHLNDLNHEVEQLKKQYASFVRTRQAATQSYEGYNGTIKTQRSRIKKAMKNVNELMKYQGNMLEAMAVNELTARRERLAEFQTKARFATAESYDRATRDQINKKVNTKVNP